MSTPALRVENVSKMYRLGEVGTGSLSHDLNRAWARLRGRPDPYARVGAINDRTSAGTRDFVWALRDIDFEVGQGEIVGIIALIMTFGPFFYLMAYRLGGLKLAIWARSDLAFDTGLPEQPVSSTAFTIGQNVSQREDVGRIMEQARRAGAEIIKAPQDTFYGGHAGYFRDPDGHLWEIVWNPQMLPQQD